MQTQIVPATPPEPPVNPKLKRQLPLLKGGSNPLRALLRPMLYLSIAGHALLLFLPTGAKDGNKPKVPEKAVKISQLPPTTRSGAKKAQPKPAAVLPKTPVATTPKQTTIPAPNPVQKKAEELATKPPEKLPTDSPKPPDTAPDQPGDNAPGATTTFPHYPAAQPGCLGLQACYAVGKPIADVTAYFEKELPNKKYKVENISPSKGTAEDKFYQITDSAGVTQVLSVLVNPTGTIYTVQQAAVDLQDLQKAVQVSPEFTNNIMGTLPPPAGELGATKIDPTPDDFSSPDSFFAVLGGQDEAGFDVAPTAKDQIDTMKLAPGTPAELYASYFDPRLKAGGFEVNPLPDGYGGGTLFQIKKGGKPFYLNLVPTKSGGTAVVIWLTQPV
jgi:hypothetical protein